MIAALLSAVLLVSDSTASTTSSQPVANDSVAAEAPKDDRKICKRQPVTGQLQGTKRVCMTAEQWKSVRDGSSRSKR